MRHLSGKVLWTQEKTNPGELTSRQVGTTWNMAGVGTKALLQHRLFVLMNEIGMVYVNTFEDVCIEEHQRQVEKSHNSQQLQKAAKLIMRLCVAMGLEPTGAAAQQCTTPGVVCRDQVAYNFHGGFACMCNGWTGNVWMEETEGSNARCRPFRCNWQITTTMQHGCANVWII